MKLVFYAIIIAFCFAFYSNSYAQQVYFNKQYPNTKYVGYSSLLADSVNIYGIGYNVSNPATQKFIFAKHSYNGDTILVKSLLDNDTINYVSGVVYNLCKIKSNFFFIGGEEYPTQLINNEPKGAGFLLKINDIGDTLLKKNFNPFNSYRNNLNSILAISNNSLVVLGSNVKLDSLNQRQVKVYIANIDTLGNIIWEHEYGFNNQIAVTNQIIVANDGGYYIPGWIDDAASGIQYDYYLLKIDSVGNLVYQRQWGVNDKYESLNGIYTTESGNVIGTGSESTTGFYYYKRPFLCKFNSTGVMTERRYLFNSEGESSLYKIFKHKNHYLTLCFYQPNIDLYRKIAFVEFGENLDSINTTIFDFNGNQNIYNMIQLPDKGYLLGGFFKNPGQTPFQNAWLMRIDSNLCANTSCIPVGIEELYQTFGQKTEVKIYPNPTNSAITIELENFDKNTSYELVEITGKLLETGKFNSALNTINLLQYNNGIYFLKTNFSNQQTRISKIIVSK